MIFLDQHEELQKITISHDLSHHNKQKYYSFFLRNFTKSMVLYITITTLSPLYWHTSAIAVIHNPRKAHTKASKVL